MISRGLSRFPERRIQWIAVAAAACLSLASAAVGTVYAEVVDRVAAIIDQQVITLSEVNQMVQIRFFPRRIGTSEDDYRREVLEALIAQALRLRDVQRFGVQDVPKESVETRVQEIQKRFASPAEFAAAMQHAELSGDDLRGLVKRQLQVETYIQDKIAQVISVASEEIQNDYNTTWSERRRQRGLPIPPLAEAREEIRAILKAKRLQSDIDEWTAQLRARANVDVFTWRE